MRRLNKSHGAKLAKPRRTFGRRGAFRAVNKPPVGNLESEPRSEQNKGEDKDAALRRPENGEECVEEQEPAHQRQQQVACRNIAVAPSVTGAKACENHDHTLYG